MSDVVCWLCFVCHIQTREDLFEEMLQEPNEIAVKRKRCRELLQAYQQAFRVRDFSTLQSALSNWSSVYFLWWSLCLWLSVEMSMIFDFHFLLLTYKNKRQSGAIKRLLCTWSEERISLFVWVYNIYTWEFVFIFKTYFRSWKKYFSFGLFKFYI